MTNEMHNSYNRFLFRSFLSALHVSNESSRSSSGARHNILYYTHSTIGTIVQASLDCRAPDDERLDSFETRRADRKL